MRVMAAALLGVLGAASLRAQDRPSSPSNDPNLPIRIEEIRRMVLEERRRAAEEAARERRAARTAGSEASTPRPGRLQLGAYGRPSSPREFETFLMTPEGPRFETYVEVYGRTHQERIEEILRDADLLHGPAPRHSSATLEEMKDYRSVTQGANLLPAIDWLVDQVKKKLGK